VKKRIVISGSYGTRNVGDEAILTVLVERLRSRGFAIDILTFTPTETAERHPGATAVRSAVFRGSAGTIAAIRRAAALVVGGGGILQDATSLGNLLLHVSRPEMAALSGTPVVVTGVGVGPLKRSLSRWLVRRTCQIASSVDVRDAHSSMLLNVIGVPEDSVVQSADFAHLLAGHSDDEMDTVGRAVVDTLRNSRQQGRRLVGLSLRPPVGNLSRRRTMTQGDRALIESMAKIVDSIIDRHNAQLVFVSMHPDQDDPIAGLLIRQMRQQDRLSLVSGRLPPATIKAAVAELDVMLGTRLHSLIFAACNETPIIALAYDDKVAAYAESLGLGAQVLRRDEWQADRILGLVTGTLESRQSIRAQLSAAVPQLIARAEESVDRICASAHAKC